MKKIIIEIRCAIISIKNFWRFRKELWRFRDWDYIYTLSLFRKGLEQMVVAIERGYEEEVSRGKKVEKMKRVIELINHIENDTFIEQAEKELGYEMNHDYWMKSEPEEITKANRAISHKSWGIEESEWRELWEIIKGKEMEAFKIPEGTSCDDVYEEHQKIFDGSGLKGWWD